LALLPTFYISVKKIIENGYDGFLINRRTLSKSYNSISQLTSIYADIGEIHPAMIVSSLNGIFIRNLSWVKHA